MKAGAKRAAAVAVWTVLALLAQAEANRRLWRFASLDPAQWSFVWTGFVSGRVNFHRWNEVSWLLANSGLVLVWLIGLRRVSALLVRLPDLLLTRASTWRADPDEPLTSDDAWDFQPLGVVEAQVAAGPAEYDDLGIDTNALAEAMAQDLTGAQAQDDLEAALEELEGDAGLDDGSAAVGDGAPDGAAVPDGGGRTAGPARPPAQDLIPPAPAYATNQVLQHLVRLGYGRGLVRDVPIPVLSLQAIGRSSDVIDVVVLDGRGLYAVCVAAFPGAMLEPDERECWWTMPGVRLLSPVYRAKALALGLDALLAGRLHAKAVAVVAFCSGELHVKAGHEGVWRQYGVDVAVIPPAAVRNPSPAYYPCDLAGVLGTAAGDPPPDILAFLRAAAAQRQPVTEGTP